MQFSRRLKSMEASPIRKLAPFAKAAIDDGVKVYHLNIGQPDIETPKCFFDAIKNFNEPVLEYAQSQGITELIHALQKYYKTYDIDFDENDILITNGASEALLFTLMAICDPGDNMLTPEPFYTNYGGFGKSINVDVKPITTTAENGFHLPSKEEILSLIDDNTRAILVCNPGNPTGCVYTKEEIMMLSDIAKEKDLWLVSDEVYREFIYENLKFTSFANIDYIEDRCILIDSISKRYSACGARIGSIACKNNKLIEEILKLCQGRLCISTLDQIGGAALYNQTPKSYLEDINKEYHKRRDVLYEELTKIEGLICEKPMGAFYIVAKLPIEDSEDFAIWMLKDFRLNNETVMVTPASGFYVTEGLGKNEVRLAYVLNENDLRKCGNIISEGLKQYKLSKACN